MENVGLERELNWFELVLETSLNGYFQDEQDATIGLELAPLHQSGDGIYTDFILEQQLDESERFVLMMAFVPVLRPQALDLLLVKNGVLGAEYTEFGRYRNTQQNGFVPTLETACFILTRATLELRLNFMRNFDSQHPFFKNDILILDLDQEAPLEQRLALSKSYEQLFLTGKEALPQFGAKFPAREIRTNLLWEDLVVEEAVYEDLLEIQEWLDHSQLILKDWGMEKELKMGFRALFYGPPGTGKTLAATLLGKMTGRPVYRVDLSAVVSKYIGETEKNLGKLFDTAVAKDWILFFDEADALFGKRTQTKGSNDRYANQEVAYLLQRIEDYNGLVILASNLQTNIDEAFARRFQSSIYFPKPKAEERKKLWQKLLFSHFEMEAPQEAEKEIEKYELSGGQMINVLRYCAIQAAKRKEKKTSLTDIITAIKREYNKESKTL